MPPLDVLCSQGSSHAFLDALTNICVLEGIDPRDPAMAAEGSLPLERLSLLVHEYTHHWCLYSPLGTALSITKIDAIRAWLGTKPNQPRDLAALERWQTVATLAGMWTEGLAQYAEFDAAPGQAKSATSVARVVGQLFCKQEILEADTDSAAWALIADRLRQSRALYSTAVRKATTFRSSFSTRGGGYLSGYMLIKVLANKLLPVGGPFADTDFIMCYLKEYVFNDDWLALAALGRRGQGNLLEMMLDHFSERIAALVNTPADELRRAGEEFDEATAAIRITDQSRPVPFPGLGVDSQDTLEACELLEQRLSDSGDQKTPMRESEPGSLDESSEVLARMEKILKETEEAIYRQRRYLCLGATEVKNPRRALLRSGQSVILYSLPSEEIGGLGGILPVYNRERYADFDHIDNFEIDKANVRNVAGYPENSATLEIWCEPRSGCVYAALFVDTRRVGIMVLLGPAGLDDIPFDLLPRDKTINDMHAATERVLDKSMRTSGGPPQPRRLGDEFDASQQYIWSQVDGVLADLLLGWRDGRGRRAAAQLADRGLAQAPGGSSAALLDLARFTLSPDSADCPEHVTRLLSELNSFGIVARNSGGWQI